MTSAIYYFGALPSSTQTVSNEMRSKGINLLRSSPSSVFPMVSREFTTPQYDLYCTNFAAFIQAVFTKKPVKLEDKTIYYVPVHKTIPDVMSNPTIVWGYADQKDSSFVEDIKARFNAVEILAKGKPVFSAELTLPQAQSIMKTNPTLTSPTSTTTINLSTYTTYVYLWRLADLFLRVNQYPLVKYGEDKVSLARDFVQVTGWTEITKGSGVSSLRINTVRGVVLIYGINKNYSVPTGGFQFHGNLPTDLGKIDYYSRNKADLLNDGGMIFPFVAELARDDDSIVIRTLERYFFEMLGSTSAVAMDRMNTIRADWGCLKATRWGDELAHLYAGIDLCFQTGTALDIIPTARTRYGGFILYGGSFTLQRHDVEYGPVSYTDLQTAFESASPHDAALLELYGMIHFPDDITRVGAHAAARRIGDVARDLRRYGFDMMEREKIKQLAGQIEFGVDTSLPLNGPEVARVIAAIKDTSKPETDFPLHRLAILEPDRAKRLLSAFGAYGPSFKIPGGRKLSLETESFKYIRKAVGPAKKKVEQTTTRIFCQVVPWEQACKDLADVISEKSIWSPVGTPISARASTRSMLREFEGVAGANVVAALKSLSGVSISGEPSTAGGKRKAEDEAGGSAKRTKEDEAAFEL